MDSVLCKKELIRWPMRSAKPIRPQVALLVLPPAEDLGRTNAHFVKRMFKREPKHYNVTSVWVKKQN